MKEKGACFSNSHYLGKFYAYNNSIVGFILRYLFAQLSRSFHIEQIKGLKAYPNFIKDSIPFQNKYYEEKCSFPFYKSVTKNE